MSNESAEPIPEIDVALFQLSEEALTDDARKKALTNLQEYTDYHKKYFLGYQANQELNYQEELGRYLNLQLNNVGDPFAEGNFKLNTKWIEKIVLEYYAKLWNVPFPHDPKNRDTFWGYVVSMGGTEGNLYGLRNARDYLSGVAIDIDYENNPEHINTAYKLLVEQNSNSTPSSSEISAGSQIHEVPHTQHQIQVESKKYRGTFNDHQPSIAGSFFHSYDTAKEEKSNAYLPVLFFSDDTHYSVSKIKDLINFPTFAELGNERYPYQCPLEGQPKFPSHVPSNEDGSINLESLYKLVEFFALKNHPIAICFNFGTTFKGAYDAVDEAVKHITDFLKENQIYERKLTVILNNGEKKEITRTSFWFHVDGALGAAYGNFLKPTHPELPSFDFTNDIQSISMSGHKEIGCPWPSGIYMTRTKYLLHFSEVSYIGAQDSTLAGSRNGFSALILWHYLTRYSVKKQTEKAQSLVRVAKYAFKKLKALEDEFKKDLHVEHAPETSLTVRFLKPNPHIISKFSLSVETIVKSDGTNIEYAHLFAMEHVKTETIDALIEALRSDFKGSVTHPPHKASLILAPRGSGFF